MLGTRNSPALSFDPTARPRNIVTMLINAFCVVSDSRSTTPHSRIRLPNASMPSSGAADGSSSATSNNNSSGKMMRSAFDTSRSCTISILRSSSVVSSFMMGGWINGTSAM